MFLICFAIFVIVMVVWAIYAMIDSREEDDKSGNRSQQTTTNSGTKNVTGTSGGGSTSNSHIVLRIPSPSSNSKSNKYSNVKTAPRYSEFLNQVINKKIYLDEGDCNSFLIEALRSSDYTNASRNIISYMEKNINDNLNRTHTEKFGFRVDNDERLVVYNNSASGARSVIYRGTNQVTDMMAVSVMFRVYCDIYDCANVTKAVKISRLSMSIDNYQDDYTKERFAINYQIN